MNRFIAAAVIASSLFAAPALALAAEDTSYTFSGVNIITDGSTNDITDVKLTDDITVTTSGDMNRKYAAVTDLEHNSEVGTFPADDEFKADGSYIYLATASSNDNTIITLNVPKIEKGSKVTMTFAKPIVTNNGSTLRNTGDPYAYFQIADRYISINGDNFNTWRTESVTTGEDTDKIIFRCDKWGAVAISKIEISDGDGTKLYDLDISSNRYSNINVNGIKFFSDETGNITIPSLPEGENITVIAEKDGYTSDEKNITIGEGENKLDITLECETDSAYYESDFSGGSGILTLDGSYPLDTDTLPLTSFKGNITFTDGGAFTVTSRDGSNVINAEYKDGIYINGKLITVKDNMEFEAVLDCDKNKVVITQNGKVTETDADLSDISGLASIQGSGVSFEYIGISYPDMSKISISGPDHISVSEGFSKSVQYTAVPEYMRSGTSVTYSVSGSDNVSIDNTGLLTVGDGSSGIITLCAQYNGASEYKQIELVSQPSITSWSGKSRTMEIGSSAPFKIGSCKDDYDGDVQYTLKDFSSSNESVIKIDKNGIMTAVGKGTAVISANAYTGKDNPVSVEYTVDKYYSSGITESATSYAAGGICSDENIKGYVIYYQDGLSENITETEIPATAADSDGMLITVMYNSDGTLASVRCASAVSGDMLPVSNGTRHEYYKTENSFSELKDASSSMPGFKIEHTAGVPFEIAPVYRFENIGDVKDEGKELTDSLADGFYDITFKKAETSRGDIYVNGYMVGNNVDQADADRKVTDGALYSAEDIKINGGSLNISMCDGSTMLDYVEAIKKPEFYERPQRVYIIGDSLACEYYGSFENEVGGGRSGWGQQLGYFLNVPVTNLANSGQYAAGLYTTAFPSVIENGVPGDILLIECAYNDRNYSTREEMTECVKSMIEQCRENDIVPILVTPNASQHDYKPSVVWSSYLKDIAVDTNCECIDLSKESYEFLYSIYGDDADGNITKTYNLTEVGGDNLHSSYAGAYKWASIVAQGLKDLGYEDIVNTDFIYTFTDSMGNEITAEVK